MICIDRSVHCFIEGHPPDRGWWYFRIVEHDTSARAPRHDCCLDPAGEVGRKDSLLDVYATESSVYQETDLASLTSGIRVRRARLGTDGSSRQARPPDPPNVDKIPQMIFFLDIHSYTLPPALRRRSKVLGRLNPCGPFTVTNDSLTAVWRFFPLLRRMAMGSHYHPSQQTPWPSSNISHTSLNRLLEHRERN
jgi:hypothetical protein